MVFEDSEIRNGHGISFGSDGVGGVRNVSFRKHTQANLRLVVMSSLRCVLIVSVKMEPFSGLFYDYSLPIIQERTVGLF